MVLLCDAVREPSSTWLTAHYDEGVISNTLGTLCNTISAIDIFYIYLSNTVEIHITQLSACLSLAAVDPLLS